MVCGIRDARGRFAGPRRNVEGAPRLTAHIVGQIAAAESDAPYACVWKGAIWATLKALGPELVLFSSPCGEARLQLRWDAVPRCSRRWAIVLCPACRHPRRHLYLRGRGSFCPPRCRVCLGLLWGTQGRYWNASRRRNDEIEKAFAFEVGRPRARFPLPRPPLWDPEVTPLVGALPSEATFQPDENEPVRTTG